jgi:hypothetical protein
MSELNLPFSNFEVSSANELPINNPNQLGLEIGFGEIEQFVGNNILQDIMDIFNGGQNREVAMESFRLKLEVTQRRDLALNKYALTKLETFKFLCLEWQKREVEIASKTIIVENGSLKISIPTDLEKDKLTSIIALLKA